MARKLCKKVDVLEILACCAIIHKLLIRMGDYGVLDCANDDADRALIVMQAALDSNVIHGFEYQSDHVYIGRITRNNHLFFTSDELYVLRRPDLTSLAEHVSIIGEFVELHNRLSVDL